MVRKFCVPLLLGMSIIIARPADCQKGSNASERAKGVPEQYAGNWVCQTSLPGYNILPPHADQSQPQTNRMTTPPTVAVLKFSLKTDGTYEAPGTKGHYAFDSVTKAITWLDGPHKSTVTKTQLGNRENGAPKMGFVYNKRYYGCFMPVPQRQ